MKNLFVLAAFLLCSCLTMQAQEANIATEELADPVTEAVQEDQASPALLPAWVELSSVNVNNVNLMAADDINNEKIASGKLLRGIGMGLTGAGAVGFSFCFAGLFKDDFNDDGEVIGHAIGLYYCTMMSCAAIATGIVLWSVGNHKIKKGRLSASGSGLAYNF